MYMLSLVVLVTLGSDIVTLYITGPHTLLFLLSEIVHNIVKLLSLTTEIVIAGADGVPM